MRTRLRLLAAGLTIAAVGLAWIVRPSGALIYLASGFPDCEGFRSGWLVQPTLAQTSLVFTVLGVWMVGDRRAMPRAAMLLGTATVAVGLGSFLGHARPDDWARTLDAVTVKLLVAAFLAYGLHRWLNLSLWSWLAGLTGAAVLLELALPQASDGVLGVGGAAAMVATWMSVTPGRRWLLVAGAGALAAAAVAWWWGRAESSFCSPDSWLQSHAAWHILAAASLALFYSAYRDEVA